MKKLIYDSEDFGECAVCGFDGYLTEVEVDENGKKEKWCEDCIISNNSRNQPEPFFN